MDASAIEVGQLKKFFRKMPALNDVDLVVRPGEIFALLGPNGAGKTTLIKILSGLVLPDGGKATIFGNDVVKDSGRVRSLISLVVGEERSFYWRLTGRQNLEFFATLYNLRQKEARQRIDSVAFVMGDESLDKRYQEYSSGAKQRLALIRSFLNNSKMIFMDEPTRSLDPGAALKLRALIKNDFAKRGDKTIFFTTHNTIEAEHLADRIAVLHKGKIKACGSLEELRVFVKDPKASVEDIFHRLTLEN